MKIAKFIIFLFVSQGVLLSASPDFTEMELKAARDEIELKETINNLYMSQRFDLLRQVPGYMQKLRSISPESPELPYFEGLILYRKGELAQAMLQFETAVSLDPSFDSAWNIMGLMYLQSDRIEDAEAAFRKAALASPYNPSYIYNLANLLFRKGNLTEAELFSRLAIEFKPNFSEAYYLTGLILREKKLEEDSVSEFQEALRFGLRTEAFLLDYLKLAAKLELDNQSLQIAELIGNTENPEALRIHAKLRMKYGEFSRASTLLQKLISLKDVTISDKKLFLLSYEKQGQDGMRLLQRLAGSEEERLELEAYVREIRSERSGPALKDPIMHPIL